jgi:hypothetical protein
LIGLIEATNYCPKYTILKRLHVNDNRVCVSFNNAGHCIQVNDFALSDQKWGISKFAMPGSAFKFHDIIGVAGNEFIIGVIVFVK